MIEIGGIKYNVKAVRTLRFASCGQCDLEDHCVNTPVNLLEEGCRLCKGLYYRGCGGCTGCDEGADEYCWMEHWGFCLKEKIND